MMCSEKWGPDTEDVGGLGTRMLFGHSEWRV